MKSKERTSLSPAGTKLKRDRIRVSGDSIFYTLQGEGATLGMPVIFLRLHECNLKCVWCDAWYTWDESRPEYWSEAVEWMTDDAIDIMANAMQEHACSRWVITGGEPMMQKWALDNVMAGIYDKGASVIEFETNGTILPTDYMADMSKQGRVQFNCSPKIKNSGNAVHQMYKPHVLEELSHLDTWFKFVVSRVEDLEEILQYAAYIPNDRIILMPEGTTMEELEEHSTICDQMCKKMGWRLTPRMQILLYGDKRAT